jgi:NACHT domain
MRGRTTTSHVKPSTREQGDGLPKVTLFSSGNRPVSSSGFMGNVCLSPSSVYTVAENDLVTAGSGKSVLRCVALPLSPCRRTNYLGSSAIIQDIEEMRDDGSSSIAFFFFDFRDDEKQTRRNLLSSLLVQLCDQSDTHYDILFKFYSKFDHGSRPPSDKEVTHCLREMLNAQRQGPIYFVIDALDECPGTFGIPSARENVLTLIQELVDLRCSNLHICITSRPEPDIETTLSRFAFNSVSLHDEDGQKQDIIHYIHHVVNSDPKMQKWRPEDKRLVIDTLSERANGM